MEEWTWVNPLNIDGECCGSYYEVVTDLNTEMATCQPRRGLGRVQEFVLTVAFLTSGTVQDS